MEPLSLVETELRGAGIQGIFSQEKQEPQTRSKPTFPLDQGSILSNLRGRKKSPLKPKIVVELQDRESKKEKTRINSSLTQKNFIKYTLP